ncbi:hypothetical protein C810_05186 [Lachnospiraceae bacterium A2]|nr:hypothetical protein C810_05186 [Lachnospiraceae bacterium A2]
MEIMEAIESLKNNNELCLDNCEGECGSYKDGKCYCADALVVSALEEYIAIGTVEECREARERQRGKKPEFELNLSDYTSRFVCECGKRVIVKHDSGVMDNHYAPNYCSNCGQRFDWSDTD